MTTPYTRTTSSLLCAALALVTFTFSSAAPAEAASTGAQCRKAGVVRSDLICRAGRDGVLRWQGYSRQTGTRRGVTTFDGMPFAHTLPAGLSPLEVAFRFAKDWTALQACRSWGPDNHNESGKNEVGPISGPCNRAVWGTPNAPRDWRAGLISDAAYHHPVAVLWEKYTSYGAVLMHDRCPEAQGWKIVCTGLPYETASIYPGPRLTHHIFYDRMRLVYGGETWYTQVVNGTEIVERVSREVRAGDPAYHPVVAAQFARTPVDAAYWEYPGCRLLTTDIRDMMNTCKVYWAFQHIDPKW